MGGDSPWVNCDNSQRIRDLQKGTIDQVNRIVMSGIISNADLANACSRVVEVLVVNDSNHVSFR